MDKGSASPKRRGRPPLSGDRGKRYNLGIRTTKELKDLIEGAADSSGRSVAQEIERRLWLSFKLPDLPFLISLAAAYDSNREWGIVYELMTQAGRDETERWRRWHAMASALFTYRANHPLKEPEATEAAAVQPQARGDKA